MDGGSSIPSAAAAAAAAAAMSLPLGGFASSAHGLGANPLLLQLGHGFPGHQAIPTTSALDTGMPGLAFPPSRPVLHVPHFDQVQFQTVNLNTEPSARQDGSDLPISLPTLRFFFNLGVQYAKMLALQQAKDNNAQNAQNAIPNFLSLLQNQQAAADPLNGFLNAAQQQQLLRNQANLLAAGKLPQLAGVGGANLLQQQILQQLQKSQQTLLQQQQQQQQQRAAGNSVENNMLQYALSQHYNRQEGAALNDLAHLQRLQTANTNAALINAAAAQQSQLASFPELMKPSVNSAAHIPSTTISAAPTSTTSPRTLSVPVDPTPPVLTGGGGFQASEELMKKRQEALQQRHLEALRKASITSNSDQEALQKALMSSFCAANNIPTTSIHVPVTRSQVDQTQISIVAAIEQQQAALQSGAFAKPAVTSAPSTSASLEPSVSSSAEVSSPSQSLLTNSEQHYTNAFKKAHQAVHGWVPYAPPPHRSVCSEGLQAQTPQQQQNTTPPAPMSAAAADVARDVKDTIASIATKAGRPAEEAKEFPMGPIMMLPVFNSCFQNVKYSLAHKGYEIGVDDQFRAIDYSSRPVDDIFRRAQKEREKEAHLLNPGFRKSISPQNRNETLMESELIQQAQQSALRNSCPIGIANPIREKSPAVSLEGAHPQSAAKSPQKRESPAERNGEAEAPEIVADSPEEKRLRIASGSDDD